MLEDKSIGLTIEKASVTAAVGRCLLGRNATNVNSNLPLCRPTGLSQHPTLSVIISILIGGSIFEVDEWLLVIGQQPARDALTGQDCLIALLAGYNFH